MKRNLTQQHIDQFTAYLLNEEKSRTTVEKYRRDVSAFLRWLGAREVNKAVILHYKEHLMGHYAVASVDSMLSALNSFFTYRQWLDCKVKTIKQQKQIFCPEERELTKQDYMSLLQAAYSQKNKQMYYVLQTICATGIRVSELPYITAEAVREGRANVACKGKMRTIFLPKDLCGILKQYLKQQKITEGSVFVTRNGKPLHRSNIWKQMQRLCSLAGVPKDKVYPHNLRHLFARTYYAQQKDIVRLADILGHSSINTTRIYTIESGDVHRRQIQRLGLVDDRYC